MQRIGIDQLKPDIKLAKDVYSFDGQLLLPKGTIINPGHLERLSRRGIVQVYILDASPSSTTTQEVFNHMYQESLDTVKSFMHEARLGKPLPEDEVKGLVDNLLENVFDEINIFGQLRLMKDKDEYLFVHSMNVAILAILAARWLKCDQTTLKQVGLAGILHDIGKVFIDPQILSKPGPLTAEEFAEMKKHTVLGYNLVSQYDWIQHDVSNAILMHHEKLDGSGYPLAAKGKTVGFLARIIAVADVYDAITSNRVYSPKETPFKAVEVLWEESFGKLDPLVVRVFYDHAANFYVGQRVRLSNNEEGCIVFVDPTYPARPLVQVQNKFYNLARERSLSIIEVLD